MYPLYGKYQNSVGLLRWQNVSSVGSNDLVYKASNHSNYCLLGNKNMLLGADNFYERGGSQIFSLNASPIFPNPPAYYGLTYDRLTMYTHILVNTAITSLGDEKLEVEKVEFGTK